MKCPLTASWQRDATAARNWRSPPGTLAGLWEETNRIVRVTVQGLLGHHGVKQPGPYIELPVRAPSLAQRLADYPGLTDIS